MKAVECIISNSSVFTQGEIYSAIKSEQGENFIELLEDNYSTGLEPELTSWLCFKGPDNSYYVNNHHKDFAVFKESTCAK